MEIHIEGQESSDFEDLEDLEDDSSKWTSFCWDPEIVSPSSGSFEQDIDDSVHSHGAYVPDDSLSSPQQSHSLPQNIHESFEDVNHGQGNSDSGGHAQQRAPMTLQRAIFDGRSVTGSFDTLLDPSLRERAQPGPVEGLLASRMQHMRMTPVEEPTQQLFLWVDDTPPLLNISQPARLQVPNVSHSSRPGSSTSTTLTCPDCSMGSFATYGALNHHRRYHRLRHACDECNRRCADIRDLRRHQLTHAKIKLKPFSCDDCDKKFGRKDGLNRHRMAKHSWRRG